MSVSCCRHARQSGQRSEIDQEQRTALARRKRALYRLPRQRPAGRARRREHDVGARELVTDTVERQRRPAEARGQVLRAVRGPICYERDGCAARDEVSNRELSDLASADHNDLAPPQIAEDKRAPTRELDPSQPRC